MSNAWKVAEYFMFRHAGFPFELIEKIKFIASYRAVEHAVEAGQNESCMQKAREIFESELYLKRRQLQRIASMPKFQEAVFHQNQHDYKRGAYARIVELSRASIQRRKRNRNARRREQLAYRYLQRFCTRNETVSFFGPFSLGKFSTMKEMIAYRSLRKGKMINRKTYISIPLLVRMLHSAIDTDAILMMLKPQVAPCFKIEGARALHVITGRTITLDATCLEIIRLLGMRLTVKEIVSKQGSDGKTIMDKIRWLINKGIVLSGLEFSAKTNDPDKYMLNRLPSFPGIRQHEWYARLRKLSQLRIKFENGAFGQRQRIIRELAKIFPPLSKGSTGRELKDEKGFFTEYCESPFRYVRLDKQMRSALCDGLGAILDLALRDKQTMRKIQRQLLREWLSRTFPANPTNEVPVNDVIAQMASSREENIYPFQIGNKNLSEVSTNDLPVNFIELIDQFKGMPFVSFDAETLKKRFLEPGGNQHEPMATGCDIFISSSSKNAMNKGDYEFVLGEAHGMGQPLSVYAWVVKTSSRGKAFAREIKKIQKAISKKYRLSSFLTIPYSILDQPYDSPAVAEIDMDIRSGRKKNKIDPCALRLKWDKKTVRLIETRKKKMPLLLLHGARPLYSLFSMLYPVISNTRTAQEKSHFPRVKINTCILQREQWVFLKKDLFFAKASYQKSGIELWVELQEWRMREHIPRHFFLKTGRAHKPVFIDFQNYFAIEIFLNFSKKAQERLYIIEMLPGPEKLWLKDGAGRYTSEFRLMVYRM